MAKIPVILDTDIGGDIDDTWALALLLKSPELDLKLVVTDTGNTAYRAQVAAKLLEIAGRTDVPVGIGLHQSSETGPQAPWVQDYDLTSYGGTVVQDGVGALVDTIMGSPEPVTLVCIGPVPNIAAALQREPAIAQHARFVGMHGSVYRGYGGSVEVSAEYNVKADVPACRAVFAAPWEVTVTPLDTCGLVQLRGEKYHAVRECDDPVTRAVVENYRIWAQHVPGWGAKHDQDAATSTLFDTVAVYLAFSEDVLEMQPLGLRVTGDGYTVVDEKAKPVRCATAWKDLSAFEDLLVRRLTIG
ncbi:MAG: nucleoside hydrolase [Anaerolineae bacterium]|nr:nucleoside hydrolase [Anaerolineae bacterium]